MDIRDRKLKKQHGFNMNEINRVQNMIFQPQSSDHHTLVSTTRTELVLVNIALMPGASLLWFAFMHRVTFFCSSRPKKQHPTR